MEELASFVEKRPRAEAAFGYGSGVFKQVGYDTKSHPQRDVIFLVSDLKKWHLENMDRNPEDYSLIGRVHLTNSPVENIKGLNKITYFSHIREHGFSYKYGVIEERDFLHNLSTWDNMFITGRFQKPVMRIHSNDGVDEAIKYDRECALRIACLLNQSETTVKKVLLSLCSLSYMGDTRMLFAENPNKVKNIVEGSYEVLSGVYMTPREYMHVHGDNVIINHRMLLSEIEFLPSSLVEYLASLNTDLSNLKQVRANIVQFLTEHNKRESFYQTLDGFRTNGIVRSVPYVLSKVKKRINGK
jgi:translocator assembly and maintenance protein 41